MDLELTWSRFLWPNPHFGGCSGLGERWNMRRTFRNEDTRYRWFLTSRPSEANTFTREMWWDFANFWLFEGVVVGRSCILSLVIKISIVVLGKCEMFIVKFRKENFEKREIFRVNVFIGRRFHIGKMNEILSHNFRAKNSRNFKMAETYWIKYDFCYHILERWIIVLSRNSDQIQESKLNYTLSNLINKQHP